MLFSKVAIFWRRVLWRLEGEREGEGGWRSGGSSSVGGKQLLGRDWDRGRHRDSCGENAKRQGLARWLWWWLSFSCGCIWQVMRVGAWLDWSPLTFLYGFDQKLNKRNQEWSTLAKKKGHMMVLVVGSLMLVAHLPFLAFSASSSSSGSGADFEEDFVHRCQSWSLWPQSCGALCQKFYCECPECISNIVIRTTSQQNYLETFELLNFFVKSICQHLN